MTKQEQTPNTLSESENSASVPSDMVPEKFKNEKGQLNERALLKSYLELEKKLSSQKTKNSTESKPEKPDDYQIKIQSPLMKNDPEINRYLFDLGLTNTQAQGIYDLAAQKVVPLLQDLSETFKMEKDLSDLSQVFGGAEQFNTTARQISAWGEKNLSPEIFNALSGSKEGILALYQMMKNSQEPSVLSSQTESKEPDTEDSLKRLMQDPKYWKYQDPALVKRVEDGFKRLYG